jgi:hypothetical protein
MGAGAVAPAASAVIGVLKVMRSCSGRGFSPWGEKLATPALNANDDHKDNSKGTSLDMIRAGG